MKTLIAQLTAAVESARISLDNIHQAHTEACYAAPLAVAPLLKKIEQFRDLRNELQDLLSAVERTSNPHLNKSCQMMSADQLFAIDSFKHDGVAYFATGKQGEDVGSGQASAEFAQYENNAVRVWMRQDGKVSAE